MSQTIPTLQGEPYYTQRTKLDGREFVLRFAWNQGLARWFLDIMADDGSMLVAGLRLVPNWPLLRFYQYDSRVPQGDLRVMTFDPTSEPPGLDDMGVGLRCELTYFPRTG